MFFAIIIPTYQREDGKTPFYLKRALDSVFAQTYNRFVVFLIGDHYEDNEELLNIVSSYPEYKIRIENLPKAVERDKYKGSEILWTCGGTVATNHGIDRAESEGFDYICLLDHDDYWLPNHLQILYEAVIATRADWFCTRSTFGKGGNTLPRIKTNKSIIETPPLPEGMVKASACFNIKTIPLRLRNVFEETGKAFAGDADLWRRSAEFIKQHNLKSYHLNTLTCVHESEGSDSLYHLRTPLITLITPTGDRPEAFELTRRWIESQTRKANQWIVVDDGIVPLPERLRLGIEYVRRNPTKGERCTLNINIATALSRVKGRKIFIIEDDDWYGPTYIETMLGYLDTYDLVGEGNARYFNLAAMKYRRIKNAVHISLCQTGFNRSLLSTFEKYIPGDPFIDKRFWDSVDNKFIFLDLEDKLHLHCSIKGLRGRRGIAVGHNPNDPFFNMIKEENEISGLQQLINWVGRDSTELYLAHLGKTIESEERPKFTWRDKLAAVA